MGLVATMPGGPPVTSSSTPPVCLIKLLAVAVSPACALLRGLRVVRVASAGDFRVEVEPLVERRGRGRAEHGRRAGLRAAPRGARAGKRGYAGAGDGH